MGSVLAEFAEVFDKNPTGDVVGAEGANAGVFFEPHGAQFLGGLGVGIGGSGGSHRHVFLADG